MASITIRNLQEDVKKRLRRQAAEHGRSLEAEARDILSRATHGQATPQTGLDLFRPLIEFREKFGGVRLEEFPDEVLRDRLEKARRKSRK